MTRRIIDESFEEEERLQKLKILAQVDIMKVLKGLGITPQQLMGGGDGKDGKPTQAAGPSDAKPPRAKMKGAKGGEPRSVVSTSG